MDQADVVIAGAGTTGCVVAGRLAEARPDLRIIVIETGRDIAQDQRVAKPLNGLFSVYEGADQVRYVQSVPLEQLEGRAPIVPVGNILGGSSSINFMMYNNAAASDFDDWHTPGWSFEELKPYIKKSECWRSDEVIDSVHGTNGKMPVSFGGHRSQYAKNYFDAMQCVKQVPLVDDLVNFRVGHGCGYLPKLISHNGQRCNTPQMYLIEPGHLRPNSNLRLLSNKTVVRVIYEGDRAVGVEVCSAPSGPLNDASEMPQKSIISASKMVIVAAGAFGSPMILERSGVGQARFLQDHGIDVKVDLPGVGAEYQDHELTICSYKLSEEGETLDDYARGDPAVRRMADKEWEDTGRGITATNGFDFGHRIRPSEQDIKEMGPVFARHWHAVAGDKPDKPLYSGPLVNYFMGPTPRPPTGKFFSMGAFLNYPAGRGRVHISSPDPNAPPVFDAGLLSHPADMPPHIWAYKYQREVARHMPYYIGEHAASHPVFDSTSSARLEVLDKPRQDSRVPPIVYSEADDRAIEAWVRRTVGTAYHSIGTCPMRPRSERGVVDPRLNVYGVENLKVADLSICPANLGTNTTTVALIVGEKAAALIIEDLQSESPTVVTPRAKL